MLLRTRRRRAIENDSLHRAQLLCSISDDPEQVSYFSCEATKGGQIRDRAGQVSVEWGEERLAVAAGSWRLRHHEPAYVCGRPPGWQA